MLATAMKLGNVVFICVSNLLEFAQKQKLLWEAYTLAVTPF